MQATALDQEQLALQFFEKLPAGRTTIVSWTKDGIIVTFPWHMISDAIKEEVQNSPLAVKSITKDDLKFLVPATYDVVLKMSANYGYNRNITQVGLTLVADLGDYVYFEKDDGARWIGMPATQENAEKYFRKAGKYREWEITFKNKTAYLAFPQVSLIRSLLGYPPLSKEQGRASVQFFSGMSVIDVIKMFGLGKWFIYWVDDLLKRGVFDLAFGDARAFNKEIFRHPADQLIKAIEADISGSLMEFLSWYDETLQAYKHEIDKKKLRAKEEKIKSLMAQSRWQTKLVCDDMNKQVMCKVADDLGITYKKSATKTALIELFVEDERFCKTVLGIDE